MRALKIGLISALTLVACGGTEPSGFLNGNDGGVTTDSAFDDSGFNFGDAGDGGSGPVMGCSPDLRNVVDGNGLVIATCPPDQGCAAGVCVPACDAAGAAKGSVGCDFVVATPSFFADLYPGYFSPCLAIFMANNWPKDVVLNVSRSGTTYDATKFGRISQAGTPPAAWAAIPSTGIPPGKVGVLFMESDPASNYKCPVAPALLTGTQVKGTGRGSAWHISSSVPVSGYDILPFGGASSFLPGATLLLPSTAWGTNYVAVVPKLGSGSQGNKGGPHWGQVVAKEDGTTIQIVPTVALPAGTGVNAAPFNVTSSYTLAAGEYIQWQAGFSFSSTPSSTAMDLSGSIIQSNKPVAFNGGNGYLCLGSATSTGGGCDSDHEQIPPVSALGFEYAVAPYFRQNADESIIYRIVGAADGTTLTFDPAVPSAPTSLKVGQMAEFEAKGAFVIKSQDAQHPFYVGQMMTGAAGGGGLGDEDYTNVLPPAQFLSKYVFYTDVTYGTTNFAIVSRKSNAGFKDVNVDCLGNVTGWKPIGASGNYEFTNVDIVRNGQPKGNNCQNGPHTATSDGPFGLTVWGLDSYASYGYPAGGNVASINTVVIPPNPR